MKKTLIALAVAGVSFNAAALDLTANATDANKAAAKYASEINLPTALTVAGNAATIKSDLPTFAPQASTGADYDVYVRYELVNATFDGTALTSGLGVGPNGITNANDVVVAHVSGGQAGTSSVVFKATVKKLDGTADDEVGIQADDVALLTIPAATKIYTNGTAGVKVSVYDNETSALRGEGALVAPVEGNLIEFTPALVAKVKTKGGATIDVTEESKLFTGTSTKEATISTLTLSAETGVYGTNGTTPAEFLDSSVLEVSGNFGAGLKKTDGTVDFTNAFALSHGSLDTDKTTNSLLVVKNAEAAPGTIEFKIDGETPLDNQNFTAVYKPTAKPGYTLDASYDLGTIGSFSKSNDGAELNLALSGNTSFSQYIRVTNNNATAATDLSFTVIDASGESAEVALADIAGNASSAPVAVKALFAQAKAKNANLNADSLLRVKVNGEAADEALSIQSYILSKDANSVNNLN